MTSTDRPYTDEDLRAHAARLYAGAANDADERIRPSVQRRWGSELDADQIDEVCDEVTGLLDRTADVSEWAVNLGADGLEPDGHTFQLGAQGTGSDDPEMPFVRMHFAFHPDATDDERDRFVMRLTKIIAANL